MSSYYASGSVEESYEERLRRALAENIKKIKQQLETTQPNCVQIFQKLNIITKVETTDEGMCESGEKVEQTIVSKENVHTTSGKHIQHREILDFSEFLAPQEHRPSKLELELQSWMWKVEERPILTEKDSSDRVRLMREVSRVADDNTIDIEDKIKQVRMMVQSYLQAASHFTEGEKEKIQSDYYEYLALCELAGEEPKEQLPYRVEKEISRLKCMLQEHDKQQYIMNVIQEAMEELGGHMKESVILEHTPGMLFSVDGHPLCDVFIGNDGNGIMFEPIGVSQNNSLDKDRQMENSANKICALYEELEEKVAEKGVFFRKIYIEPVNAEEMFVLEDVCVDKKKHRREAQEQSRKLRAFDAEV